MPNLLTLSRLLSAPGIGYLLLTHQYPFALGLFVYAGATDLIDGWLARRWKQESVVGSVLDPAADKALMLAGVVGLAWTGALPGSLIFFSSIPPNRMKRQEEVRCIIGCNAKGRLCRSINDLAI